MTDSHLTSPDSASNRDWTISQKLYLEAAQIGHGIGSGIVNTAKERFIDHPMDAVAEALPAAALGFGLSALAYHVPRAAMVAGIIGQATLVADGIVRGANTVYAGIDTWKHPENYARNEKFTEKQLGAGIVDYAIMGVAGGASYSYGHRGFLKGDKLVGGLEDAFINGSGDIPKLEISKVFEHPLARFQALDDSRAAKIFSNNQESIVRVDCRTGMQETAGTGFIVDGQKGWIATNWHVGNPAEHVHIITPDGTATSLEFIGGDLQADLAVWKTMDKPRKPWQELQLGQSHGLKPGDNLYAIGHPHCVTPEILTTGNFGEFQENQPMIPTAEPPKVVRIMAQLPLLPGSSGSPIFDDTGRVVAVLNSGIGRTQAVGTAVEHLDALVSALRDGESTRPKWGWLDVQSNAEEDLNGMVRVPISVQTTTEARSANIPREDLSQYRSDSPGIKKIYPGLFQPAIGIPSTVLYLTRMFSKSDLAKSGTES